MPDSGVWTALKAGAWFWAAVSDAGSTWMKGFSGGEQLLEIDGQSLADFTLSCEVCFPSTTAHQAGVFFRKQDNNNYYTVYLEEGQSATSTWAVVLGKIQNGGFSKLGGAGIGETIATGKTYSLKVDASGTVLKVYIDSGSGYSLILHVTDNTFSSGGLGLRGNAAGHTQWDNVVLYDQAGQGAGKVVVEQLNDTTIRNNVPAAFALLPNYPNPFNPQTTIAFYLPQQEHASVKIYNAKGVLVKTLLAHQLAAGEHRFVWSGKNDAERQVASGVYFVHLIAGQQTAVRKILLLK
ncbi:MAG: T9SS C-terminal target domain-containing protein [Calditrichaeota bacterium]|nr:MAG: T9SS C-terminal target domain-containing protein [Calditrichota bacterium]